MDEIYYCDNCAMMHNLPLKVGNLVVGYCTLCGTTSVYVGFITEDEANERGIELPYQPFFKTNKAKNG